MPVTDSIADFITRIRNAGQAGHKTVDAPASKVKASIAALLKEQGFINDFEKIEDGVQGAIRVHLKYFKRKPVIKDIVRISKPGRRVYVPADKLPRVNNGLGIAIISTSHGIMTGKKARQINIGGEVICTVW
ncbi:MAG TPA: 30S ribosomal protein S8 [Candidatus Kapabacteria bacterium]|nr:30S ribosomal protein S8 [Candidatus Kapabacteria bacterium]